VSTPDVYCIDTNCILERGRNYPPAQFPTLWSRLESLITDGRLRASEEVLEELERVDEDEPTAWAKSQKSLFVPLDLDQTNAVAQIQEEIPELVDYRAKKSGGDPFVIALALVRGYVVLTQEKKSGPPSRPRIPNACERYKIRYVNLVGLMSAEKLIL